MVPTVVVNSNINYPENINSIVLGAYLQYYFNSKWSVFAEALPTLNGWRKQYDTYNLGLEVNTGGHFFKIYMGNGIFTNLVSTHSGAPHSFESGKLHFGFMIERNL